MMSLIETEEEEWKAAIGRDDRREAMRTKKEDTVIMTELQNTRAEVRAGLLGEMKTKLHEAVDAIDTEDRNHLHQVEAAKKLIGAALNFSNWSFLFLQQVIDEMTMNTMRERYPGAELPD
jgi:hypothetical protein